MARGHNVKGPAPPKPASLGIFAGHMAGRDATQSRSAFPMTAELPQVLRDWHETTAYGNPTDWVFASRKTHGGTPRVGNMLVAEFSWPSGHERKNHSGTAAPRQSNHNTDLYSQSIDAAKLEAQEDIALAITSTAQRISPTTREESQGSFGRIQFMGRLEITANNSSSHSAPTTRAIGTVQ